ncbi:MAG: restriction endonuclease subunit S [Planctomycetaceae bacterium]|nr:restriction endonuclease subunit S [Planctomycetaceae bacterium]
MSFPRYHKYKKSGVPWIGDIPEHWEQTRLKNLFNLMKRAPEEADEIVTAFRDGEVTLRLNRRVDGFTNAIQEHGYQRILQGDLVIHAMDAFAGAIGVSDSVGKSTPVYSVCAPKRTNVNAHYYGRLLRHMALSGYINSLAKGIRERSTEFRWNEASNVLVPVPTLDEQNQITALLERETSKIDALVAEQRRLIELLKEKRQAVISHAVTKGLNPNAPMKPSGIQWLGDVPEHWDVSRLKHATSHIVDCPHETPTINDDGEFFSIRTSDLDDGNLYPDQMRRVDRSEYLHRIRREPVLCDDIVYSREGGRWGHAALVPESDRFCLGQRMMQFRANAAFNPRYLMLHLNTKNVYRQGEVDTVGAASPHVNVETIRNYRLATPPKEEQEQIAEFVHSRTETLDRLITEVQRGIELLLERRTALISAAVTGKIDVRNFVESN